MEGNRPQSPRSILPLRSPSKLPELPWVVPLAEVVRRGEALLTFAGAKDDTTSLRVCPETFLDSAKPSDHESD